jgi:mono/diheme cytochrome c family protein
MTHPTHWNILTAAACSIAFLTGGEAWADSSGNMGGAFRSFPQTTGQALYDSICQDCHMPNAQGAIGAGRYPALADNANLETAGYPVTLVVYGQNAMPGFGGFLSDDQVAAVVNYIRTNFGNNYTDGVKSADVTAIRQPDFEYSTLD